jgi:hypothetical protein
MELKDLKNYFGSISNAARAAGVHRSHIYKMGDPIKKPWSAVFEILSDGKLKSHIDGNRK